MIQGSVDFIKQIAGGSMDLAKGSLDLVPIDELIDGLTGLSGAGEGGGK